MWSKLTLKEGVGLVTRRQKKTLPKFDRSLEACEGGFPKKKGVRMKCFRCRENHRMLIESNSVVKGFFADCPHCGFNTWHDPV